MKRFKYAGRVYKNTFGDPCAPRGLGNNCLDMYFWTIKYSPASIRTGCTSFMYRDEAMQLIATEMKNLEAHSPKLLEFCRK